jgi:ribose transport system ATP-binding protein
MMAPEERPQSCENPRGIALRATDLVKEFGPTKVLRRASITLKRGEAHALLGENGSGKSTLAKILCGVHALDAGRVEIDGAACVPASPAAASKLGIGMVFQELSLVPHLSVLDNLFLGRERCTKWSRVDFALQRHQGRRVLAEVGLDIEGSRLVSTLSMAQKQLLEIAKVLLREPRVLILDEPTASLAEAEIVQLFKLIEKLKQAEIAILYVTHHMREVLRVCDQISLIRDGRIVATQPVTSETTEQQLIFLLTGGRSRAHQRGRHGAPDETPILEVEEVETPSCASLSMRVFAGEVVGIYGVMGCGREELLRVLVGLAQPVRGRIGLHGIPYKPHTPRAALSKGVGYLCSDRKEGGIFPNLSLRENYSVSAVHKVSKGWLISPRAEKALATAGLQRLKVHYADVEQPIASLSGGNQQKILFGRAVEAEPQLLILEDATAGIDVGAKQDLYQQIAAAASAGAAFIWASSDIVETLSLCDRVYAMHGGRIVAELIDPQLDDETRLMSHVLGISPQALNA